MEPGTVLMLLVTMLAAMGPVSDGSVELEVLKELRRRVFREISPERIWKRMRKAAR
jgi:hypothetical protein